MTNLDERRYVEVPFGRAQEYVRRYVRDVRANHAGRLTLSVATPVRRTDADAVELREDVLVDFAGAIDETHLTDPIAIAWRPARGGGTLPSFAGFLVVAHDESYDSCRIMLEGAYEPPLGAVGALFDAMVGHAVAKASARRLLETIGRAIEQMYRAPSIASSL
jgi:hypothetical protein